MRNEKSIPVPTLRTHPEGGPQVGLARAAAACAVTACLLWNPAVAQQGPPPALVVGAAVTVESFNEEVEFLGTVQPVIDSLVAAEIEGSVEERLVENGDRVRKGQPMVRLDPSRLEKDLMEARAERLETLARLDLARRQEVRARELHEEKVLAPEILDERIAERKAYENSLAQVDARIASIEDDIARTEIRAPFSGIVTELHTEVGEWISRGDPVVRLADLSTVEILLDVPERHFPFLTVGDAAPARLDALPDLNLEGKIFTLVPQADEEAHSFPVRVRAPNPKGRVGAGMLARVRLSLHARTDALVVPKDAIVRQAQQSVVYLVEGDVVRAVPVQTGRSNGDRVEVTGDLKANDTVVVRGNERLVPGQKVRVEEMSAGGL